MPAKTDGSGESSPVTTPQQTAVVTPKDTTPTPPPIVQRPVIKETVPVVTAPVTDTSLNLTKSKAAFVMKPRPKKPYVEEQNVCNLVSRPELAPQLPLVINNVKPEMVALLKERYKGRLYSITGLNMIDERLKFKLKICDKDNAKFRSEYLDKDGKVVNDPDLDYD